MRTGGLFILVSLMMTVFLFSGALFADTLILKGGQQVKGKFVGRTTDAVRFEVGGQVREFKNVNVQSVEFGSSQVPPEKPAAVSEEAPTQPSLELPTGTPEIAGKRNVTLPPGTRVVVRTDSAVDSGRHRTGHSFTSRLETDLVRQDVVVAPKGSLVYGQLVDVKSPGSVAGGSEMTITFTGLLINNQMKPLSVAQIKAVSDGRTRRNAEATSEETVLRDGTGRPYGTTIPGKAGAVLPVPTRGSQINIPAGTVLEFQLAGPFTP